MPLISFPHNPTTTVDLDFLVTIAPPGTAPRHAHRPRFRLRLGFDGYMPPSILQGGGRQGCGGGDFLAVESYNMAGWRVGFCLGNPKMIAALARIKSYLDYGVFQPVQIASIIALRGVRRGHQENLCHLSKTPRRARTVLRIARWPVEKPRGSNVLMGADPREISRHRFARVLQACSRKGAQVAVSPGIGFGPLGEGHVALRSKNEQRMRHRPIPQDVMRVTRETSASLVTLHRRGSVGHIAFRRPVARSNRRGLRAMLRTYAKETQLPLGIYFNGNHRGAAVISGSPRIQPLAFTLVLG